HQRTLIVRHRAGRGVELVVHAADVRSRVAVGATFAGREAPGQGGMMAQMNESARNALGLATGIVFGALLQRGGLADSRTIVGQLTGRDSRVAKTMGTAVAVGALGHRWLHRR